MRHDLIYIVDNKAAPSEYALTITEFKILMQKSWHLYIL